jgi:hypothetical protein
MAAARGATTLCFFFAVVAILSGEPSAAATPTLFRALQPVSPNETVLLAGAGLQSASSIRFCDRHGSCASSPLLAPASSTVRAVLPGLLLDTATSTVNASVVDATGAVLLSTTLNAPIIDWWQAASGNRTTAVLGHHVRLFGRNLAWGAADGTCLPFSRAAAAPPVAVTAVRLSTGDAVPLRVTFASCYRIDALIPPPGGSRDGGGGGAGPPPPLIPGVPYALHLDTGLRGPGIGPDGTTVVVPSLVFAGDDWPAAEFFLNASGSPHPSPGCNSVPECLATAAAAGGGTVVLPAGTLVVCEQWAFPDRTAVRGAGRGATVVRWPAWCGTPVVFRPELDPNTSGGLPIVAGLPGARWRLSDLDLYGQGTGGHGYQPPLGTDFVALGYSNFAGAGSGGYGGSSARIERVNITFDLRFTPAIQLGNAFAAYGAVDFALLDSYVGHFGSCSAQWPHNCALHISNSTNGELRGNVVQMGCQSMAIESSGRIFLADNAFEEVDVWPGVGSSNGGYEWSTIDPPHVSELQYMGNSSYAGNMNAYERWESFTTDGGADSFYNSTVLGQVAHPDGTASLTLAGPVQESVFFYTWAPGDAVAVVQGPSVGQLRRLVSVEAPLNTTAVVSAPFDPPLGPSDVISITSYRGGYIVEGNRFAGGTCFQVYGGLFDSVVSGNDFVNMYSAVQDASLPSANGLSVGAGLGGGGRVYATSNQIELYNVWEHNVARCAVQFKITMGNLENGEPILLPNATFNFGQVVRRNTWDGLELATLLYTVDHVVELNAAGAAVCYSTGTEVATNVSMGSDTNTGLVYRPG